MPTLRDDLNDILPRFAPLLHKALNGPQPETVIKLIASVFHCEVADLKEHLKTDTQGAQKIHKCEYDNAAQLHALCQFPLSNRYTPVETPFADIIPPPKPKPKKVVTFEDDGEPLPRPRKISVEGIFICVMVLLLPIFYKLVDHTELKDLAVILFTYFLRDFKPIARRLYEKITQ